MADESYELNVPGLLLNQNHPLMSTSRSERMVANSTIDKYTTRLQTKVGNTKMMYLGVTDNVLYITSQFPMYNFSLEWESEPIKSEEGLEGIVINNIPGEEDFSSSHHLKFSEGKVRQELSPQKALELYKNIISNYIEDIAQNRAAARRYTEKAKTPDTKLRGLEFDT